MKRDNWKTCKVLSVLYYGDPEDSRSGHLTPGFPDYWCAPGAQLHLQVPGVTKGRESVLKLIMQVTPLNVGELKV